LSQYPTTLSARSRRAIVQIVALPGHTVTTYGSPGASQPFPRVAAQRGQPFDDTLLAAVLELDRHVLPGGKMEVKGAAGDAGSPHDIVDLRISEADAPELGERRIREPVGL
jgi:hypothetical protein